MDEIKEMPKGLIKTILPDHPFAYDGPDILISDKKGLLAIFKIRPNESRNVNKLFSRLINSLIVYPPYTKMLLLYEQNQEVPEALIQLGKYYFCEIIELKDIRRSKSLIRDSKGEYIIKEIKQIQKKLFSFQSQVQNNNLEYIRKTEFKIKKIPKLIYSDEKVMYWDNISQKEVKVKANIFKYEDQFIGSKNLSKRVSDLYELTPFYEFSIHSEFMLDNGVPYYKYLTKKVLNINDIPKIKYDPLKPTRIASLFGWHLTNSDDIQQISSRINKIEK